MARVNLKNFRKEQNITQKMLAGILGVSQGFLSNVECGRAPLPADKLNIILEHFHLESLDAYIIDEADAAPNCDNDGSADSNIKSNNGNTYSCNGNSNNSNSNNLNSNVNDLQALTSLLRFLYKDVKEDVDARHDGSVDLVQLASDKVLFASNRNDRLVMQSDQLRAELDEARREKDALRQEIMRLQTLLVKNHIDY